MVVEGLCPHLVFLLLGHQIILVLVGMLDSKVVIWVVFKLVMHLVKMAKVKARLQSLVLLHQECRLRDIMLASHGSGLGAEIRVKKINVENSLAQLQRGKYDSRNYEYRFDDIWFTYDRIP